MGILHAILFISLFSSLVVTSSAAGSTALYAFGDSTVDNGNNNNLPTVARSNYPPYGIDFPNQVSTGRFCNGFQIADYIANFLGIPLLPPYYQFQNQTVFPQGANFASASSGVLPETRLGGAVVLSEQVFAFEAARNTLFSKYGRSRAFEIISSALYFIITTNNDVNNYFQAGLPIPYDRIILEYIKQIKKLYDLGARKLVLVSPSANGCIPLNIINGECGAAAQNISITLIAQLKIEIDRFRIQLRGAKITVPNLFRLMVDVNVNPGKYAFDNSTTPCCQIFPLFPIVCQPGGTFCSDRSKFAYWDAIHNTQKFNRIAANLWWSGSPDDVSPISIRQLAHL